VTKQKSKKKNLPKSTIDLIYARRVAEGIIRVEAAFMRNTVFVVLREKFKPNEFSLNIKWAIELINDPIKLESLICHAVNCQTLDEFAEALN
jgi:hypothetical protein